MKILFLFPFFVFGKNDRNYRKTVSVDDVDIPEANRHLNYRDGDIRREFENDKNFGLLTFFVTEKCAKLAQFCKIYAKSKSQFIDKFESRPKL